MPLKRGTICHHITNNIAKATTEPNFELTEDTPNHALTSDIWIAYRANCGENSAL